MNRLQKKCVIGSAALHLLLCATLLIGPAFFTPRRPAEDSHILDVIPDSVTDGATRGGNRNAPLPAAAPVQQQAPAPPPVPAPPVRQPDRTPPPEPPRTEARDPDASDSTKKHRIEVSLTPVRRPTTSNTRSSSTTASNAAADAQRRAAAALSQAASGIRTGVSSGTAIDTDYGPGDGGPLSANYRDLVGSIYYAAWIPPDDTASDSAVVRATVTIASDGTVISQRITEPSGDAKVNASVRRALESVTRIAPFPQGAKEKERTYPLKFDLKVKRSA